MYKRLLLWSAPTALVTASVLTQYTDYNLAQKQAKFNYDFTPQKQYTSLNKLGYIGKQIKIKSMFTWQEIKKHHPLVAQNMSLEKSYGVDFMADNKEINIILPFIDFSGLAEVDTSAQSENYTDLMEEVLSKNLITKLLLANKFSSLGVLYNIYGYIPQNIENHYCIVLATQEANLVDADNGEIFEVVLPIVGYIPKEEFNKLLFGQEIANFFTRLNQRYASARLTAVKLITPNFSHLGEQELHSRSDDKTMPVIPRLKI